MSYSYLFKYTIIGDSSKKLNIFLKQNKFNVNKQESENLPFQNNLQKANLNQNTMKQSALNSVLKSFKQRTKI